MPTVSWRVSQGLLALSFLVACSASTEPAGVTAEGGPSGGNASSQPSNPSNPDMPGGLDIGVDTGGGGSAGAVSGNSCATQQATAAVERRPVDIIVVIDNSGSMQEEIDAVEKNINVNFANILQKSGVDYRVILVSRHEKKGRDTSICVTAPLSANMACPPTPDMPAFTERFYQYSLKVDSLNSLSLLVDTFDATKPDEFKLAPQGWGAWLRPNAAKVFLEITDDNSTEMTASDFVAKITAKSPQFGSAAAPSFRFHSIIGIGEKAQPTEPWLPDEAIETSLCKGNQDPVENAGPVYQELSKATGGLRFPLCQFTAFDVVFDTIAQDVASHAAIACEFPIPAPPLGRDLDLSTVAVAYAPDETVPPVTFGQAAKPEECVPSAFYVDVAKHAIVLCPEACTAAQNGKNPKVDVLFTCETTIIKPK